MAIEVCTLLLDILKSEVLDSTKESLSSKFRDETRLRPENQGSGLASVRLSN